MWEQIIWEENLFPRFFTSYEEREYGFLFYNEENKESYDSNHALIYKDKIENLNMVLNDINEFYEKKEIPLRIYQAVEDEGYFVANKNVFAQYGCSVWTGNPNKMMVLEEKSMIKISGIFDVQLQDNWNEAFITDIFEAAGEPWEIAMAKKVNMEENGRLFAAYSNGKPVGLSYMHLSDNVCRYDYILVNPHYRGKGCARDILHTMTNYCRENEIKNCFQWPAHISSERICYEAGFREKFVIIPAGANK